MLVFHTKQEQKNDVPGNILNEIIIDYGDLNVFDISDQAQLHDVYLVLGRVVWRFGILLNSSENFRISKLLGAQTSPNLQSTLD